MLSAHATHRMELIINCCCCCLLPAVSKDVQIELEGPKRKGTVWHVALYKTKDRDAAKAEYNAFTTTPGAPSWSLWFNEHKCAKSSPAGANPGGACWQWTAV